MTLLSYIRWNEIGRML